MKQFCDSGINVLNNHCAVGQQWEGQGAEILKCTKLLPRSYNIWNISENTSKQEHVMAFV